MVQVLIFLQAVQRPSTKDKDKPEVLPEAKTKTVEDWRKKTITLLDKTPPKGSRFTAAVLKMLAREERWIDWKREGCLSFEKPTRTPGLPEPVPFRAVAELLAETPQPFGSEALGGLFNSVRCSSSLSLMAPVCHPR